MLVNLMACLCLVLTKTSEYEALPAIAVLQAGLLPVEEGTVGLQFYVDIENMHQWHSCRIYSWPETCCLYDEPFEDCYTNAIYGDNIESLMPKRRETLVYVYPTMYQYDLVGYCNFVIDYKCQKKQRSTQVNIKIPFNTKLIDRQISEYVSMYSSRKKRSCKSLDEDVLNNCAPVKCDLKYNGRKPFFDKARSKCVIAPECKTNPNKELPDIVYVPNSNICRDLGADVALSEIFAISSGLGVIVQPREHNDVKEKVDVKTNCSTISQNLLLLRDLLTGKLCPLFKSDTAAYGDCAKNAVLSICACVIATCVLLISIICCIHTTLWLIRKISKRNVQDCYDSFKSKFRQDYTQVATVSQQPSRLCRDVTNNLLKEVIVRDLPVELRDSVVDICDRIGRELYHKRRYRMGDMGSRIDLMTAESDSTFASSSNKSFQSDNE